MSGRAPAMWPIYDASIERAILGSVFQEPDTIALLMRTRPEHFFDPTEWSTEWSLPATTRLTRPPRSSSMRATMAESAVTGKVAARIATLRAQRGLSQAALARQAGINRVTLARLEIGQHQPKLDTLERIARVLRVDLVSLLK